MPLQFHRAVRHMAVWSATSADISFVITFASPTGPGFHGRHGFLASWRPQYSRIGAVKVIGSPFNSFAEAEAACNAMLKTLENSDHDLQRSPSRDFEEPSGAMGRPVVRWIGPRHARAGWAKKAAGEHENGSQAKA